VDTIKRFWATLTTHWRNIIDGLPTRVSGVVPEASRLEARQLVEQRVNEAITILREGLDIEHIVKESMEEAGARYLDAETRAARRKALTAPGEMM
jgi:hypothetical protein